VASETDEPARGVSRRDLFRTMGAGAAAAVAGTPPGEAVAQPLPYLSGQSGDSRVGVQLEALETLTATEADILEAICARLIPSDENGPGAAEARAAHYIDRALTGPLRTSARLMRQVSRLSMRMRNRRKARHSFSLRRATRIRW
jgi:hypothetical protein